MKCNLIIAIALSATLASCSFNIYKASKPKADAVKEVRKADYVDCKYDIVYKIEGQDTLALDIYHKKSLSKQSVPVIVFIHGGSWVGGDKKGLQSSSYAMSETNAFVNQGYDVVSINYRLAGKNDTITFKHELADCRDAIKWIRRNATKYGFDINRIALWGASAGAHLSMVAAYQPTDSTQVSFVLNDYGPTNLNKLFRNNLPGIAKFGAKVLIPDLYKARALMLRIFPDDYCDRYSPVDMVQTYAVPTMTHHGDKDHLVSIKQAKQLNKELEDKHIPHRFHIFKGASHSFIGFNQNDIDTIVNNSLTFADSYFGK